MYPLTQETSKGDLHSAANHDVEPRASRLRKHKASQSFLCSPSLSRVYSFPSIKISPSYDSFSRLYKIPSHFASGWVLRQMSPATSEGDVPFKCQHIESDSSTVLMGAPDRNMVPCLKNLTLPILKQPRETASTVRPAPARQPRRGSVVNKPRWTCSSNASTNHSAVAEMTMPLFLAPIGPGGALVVTIFCWASARSSTADLTRLLSLPSMATDAVTRPCEYPFL